MLKFIRAPMGWVPWLLLPILAAAATWQSHDHSTHDHTHEAESEDFNRIGATKRIARGPGWETLRYETEGGFVCLDTSFSDGGQSGGCFDLNQETLQWGRARHGEIYVVSGWAPPRCEQVAVGARVIQVSRSRGWFVRQVMNPETTVTCKRRQPPNRD